MVAGLSFHRKRGASSPAGMSAWRAPMNRNLARAFGSVRAVQGFQGQQRPAAQGPTSRLLPAHFLAGLGAPSMNCLRRPA